MGGCGSRGTSTILVEELKGKVDEGKVQRMHVLGARAVQGSGFRVQGSGLESRGQGKDLVELLGLEPAGTEAEPCPCRARPAPPPMLITTPSCETRSRSERKIGVQWQGGTPKQLRRMPCPLGACWHVPMFPPPS